MIWRRESSGNRHQQRKERRSIRQHAPARGRWTCYGWSTFYPTYRNHLDTWYGTCPQTWRAHCYNELYLNTRRSNFRHNSWMLKENKWKKNTMQLSVNINKPRAESVVLNSSWYTSHGCTCRMRTSMREKTTKKDLIIHMSFTQPSVFNFSWHKSRVSAHLSDLQLYINAVNIQISLLP